MKLFGSLFVLSLLVNSSLVQSMVTEDSSSKFGGGSAPVGPVFPRDPVGPIGPDTDPVGPGPSGGGGGGGVSGVKGGVIKDDVAIGNSDIRGDLVNARGDDALDDIVGIGKGSGSSSVIGGTLLFSHRHVKPDGTGKCKVGTITGAWEKSPCSRIYGSRAIIKTSSSSNGSSHGPKGPKGKEWAAVDVDVAPGKFVDTGFQMNVAGGQEEKTNSTFKPSYLNRE